MSRCPGRVSACDGKANTEDTDFGQSRFGHPDLANLGQARFHTTTQKAQTCTFELPGLQTPPKFNENSLREREKGRNRGGRGKKKAKFCAVRRGGSGGGGDGQKKPTTHNSTQQHTTAHNSTQQGNFKDVRVSPHPKFSSILADPTFSAVGSTFLAEEEAQKC